MNHFSEKSFRRRPVTQRKVLNCTLCNKTYATKVGLNFHFNSAHRGITAVCHVCNKHFVSEAGLIAHKMLHTTPKVFVCSYCGKSFRRKDQQENHMKRIHMDRDRREFLCKTCGKGYVTRHELNLHLRRHTGTRLFSCNKDSCHKDFFSKFELDRHTAIMHTGERPFKCNPCNVSYLAEVDLQIHYQTSRHNTAKNFTCEVCKSGFNTHRGLRAHKRWMHEGGFLKVKRHTCADCNKTFHFQSQLSRHMVCHIIGRFCGETQVQALEQPMSGIHPQPLTMFGEEFSGLAVPPARPPAPIPVVPKPHPSSLAQYNIFGGAPFGFPDENNNMVFYHPLAFHFVIPVPPPNPGMFPPIIHYSEPTFPWFYISK